MATLELDRELLEVLELVDGPPETAARELMVLELYRRRTISSGKAARLLGMNRFDFIRWSGELGIPFFDMTEEEWERELQAIDETLATLRSSPTPAP